MLTNRCKRYLQSLLESDECYILLGDIELKIDSVKSEGKLIDGKRHRKTIVDLEPVHKFKDNS